MRTRPGLAAALAFNVAGALFLCPAATAAPKFEGPLDIGTPPGGSFAQVRAVNDAGQAVGTSDGFPSEWSPWGSFHALSWTAAGGMVDLGTLGGDFSSATAVNPSGQVVGTSRAAGEDRFRSFSWTAAGGMVDIDGHEGRNSSPTAIAPSGQVIGTSEPYPVCAYRCGSTPPRLQAFSWTPDGGTIAIDSLGGDHTSAVAVNNSGRVVGSSATAGNIATHAYVWTADGGMVDLGTLGGSRSGAVAISESGQVVGSSSTAGDGTSHAFSWTAEGGMVDLGSLGGSSGAIAVTQTGQVIGWSFTAQNGPHRVFSWTEAGGMVDIGTLGGPSDRVDVHAVSGSGQVIGRSGNARGYYWTSQGGMVDLGHLGGSDSYPHAVNASGVVVGSAHTADGLDHAFFWTAKGGMVDLGTLAGADFSTAHAMNNSNLVVGHSGGRGVVWELPSNKKTEKAATKT